MYDDDSSLYPNEIDDLFGDLIIFKVNKKWKDDVESIMVHGVLGVMIDHSLINIYVNPSHSAYGCLVSSTITLFMILLIGFGSFF